MINEKNIRVNQVDNFFIFFKIY